MRQTKILSACLALVVMFSLGAFFRVPIAKAASDVISAIMRDNVAATSDGVSFRVEYSPTSAVTGDFATTATVEPILTLNRTSSGTPANGIGGSVDLGVETTVGNVEVGARIASVVSDVTAASEDVGIGFYTMAAGAAASQVVSISSVGLTAIEGGLNVDGGATAINDDSGDYNFHIETDAVANAMAIDGGDDTVTWGVSFHYAPITPTGASYTLAATNKAGNMFLVDSSGGSGDYGFIIDDSEQAAGRHFCIADIVDASSNTITIVPDAGTIDGGTELDITTQYGGACIFYDGTNYWSTSKDL